MNIRARAGLSAASILLVAAGVAGCGDDSSTGASTGSSTGGASTSASKTDFCNAFDTFDKNIIKAASTDTAAVLKAIKSEAKKLRAAGTPSTISSDERSGYEAVLDAIASLPDNATTKDVTNVENNLSAADKKNAEAFQTYLDKECPDLASGS